MGWNPDCNSFTVTNLETNQNKIEAEKAAEEAKIAKEAEVERQRQEEQRRQIQDALNRQSYEEFRTYAQAQYPDNPDQQGVLIRQLQEQHYYQYMQQVSFYSFSLQKATFLIVIMFLIIFILIFAVFLILFFIFVAGVSLKIRF